MELLQGRGDRGYPSEYLLARIKGRRARMIREWKTLIFNAAQTESPSSAQPGGLIQAASGDRVWEGLMREYQWVFSRMDRRTRETFSPYFLYCELRTIFLCLRHITDRKAGTMGELLSRSLLSKEVKEALLSSADLFSAVRGIERLFLTRAKGYAGLAGMLESGGLRGVEQHITETYLAETAASGLHPLMKLFFSRLIDSRNIMSLARRLRFEHGSAPAPVPGGTVPDAWLRNAAARKDLGLVAELIRKQSGIVVEQPDPSQVERALYQGMTRWLRKKGRDPFGPAPILDYLWRCSIEAMNLSVLHHTREFERELVARELVQ